MAGRLTDEAAVERVIEQVAWLELVEFRRQFVDHRTDPEIVGTNVPMAWINWKNAIDALDGGTIIAAGVPISLRETVTNSLGRGPCHGFVDPVVVAQSWRDDGVADPRVRLAGGTTRPDVAHANSPPGAVPWPALSNGQAEVSARGILVSMW